MSDTPIADMLKESGGALETAARYAADQMLDQSVLNLYFEEQPAVVALIKQYLVNAFYAGAIHELSARRLRDEKVQALKAQTQEEAGIHTVERPNS